MKSLEWLKEQASVRQNLSNPKEETPKDDKLGSKQTKEINSILPTFSFKKLFGW